jgi:DNA modification methylase
MAAVVSGHERYHVQHADCLWGLSAMPDELVQCCVTSPPYWGLRDYGAPGQLGAEPTPEECVANLLTVFREVRRVLRDDGTLWLNLGDSYAGTGYSNHKNTRGAKRADGGKQRHGSRVAGALKAKNLVGIPWRVAFALQADGWYLRSDVIGAKGNCMPEAVEDRPTRSHEYVFLLTKRARYFYNHEAIREPLADANAQRTTDGYDTAERYGAGNGGNSGLDGLAARMRAGEHTTRNKRTVWHVNPKPYAEAHFAVMPEALVEPCAKAGCPKDGLVLDPFCGSGTIGVVALREGCRFIGLDLNPEYVALATRRIKDAAGGRWEAPGMAKPDADGQLGLF